MIQLPRLVKLENPQLHGLDVYAYKRTLRQWEGSHSVTKYLNWPPSPYYGQGAVDAVKQFQKARGTLADGVIGMHTYAELYPIIDAFDRRLLRRYVATHPLQTERGKVIDQLRWLLANHLSVFYGQVRPVALARFRDHLLPITSDCSGSIIGANFAAGAPDPGGNGYNGQGNTESFLLNLTQIGRTQLRPADIVVFGAMPGDHAVAILDTALNIYTHGHTGLPDDPREMPLADMESYFRSVGVFSVSYLRVNLP